MEDQNLWKLIRDGISRVSSEQRDITKGLLAEQGLDDHLTFLVLSVLLADDLKPKTGLHLRDVVAPYTAAARFDRKLPAAVLSGKLEHTSPDSYRLTPAGRSAISGWFDRVAAVHEKTDLLSAGQSARLAELLHRLADNATVGTYDDYRFSSYMYKLIPSRPPLHKVLRCYICIASFRSDMHRVVWRTSDLTAPAITSMTMLWNGTASTSLDVIEQLQGRGYSPEAAAETVTGLTAGNWITTPDGRLELTPAARTLRDTIESETDRLFFAPWACLNAEEKSELSELSTAIRGRCS
ncbi:MAG: helix-turn-helix domain-containing protein [Acidimicrobiales bacterium]